MPIFRDLTDDERSTLVLALTANPFAQTHTTTAQIMDDMLTLIMSERVRVVVDEMEELRAEWEAADEAAEAARARGEA